MVVALLSNVGGGLLHITDYKCLLMTRSHKLVMAN